MTTDCTPENLIQHALAYARMGYPVFPLIPQTKRPILEHGFLDATTDQMLIQHWWKRWPDANVGLATEGLVVFDQDPGGDEWLMEYIDTLEPASRQRTPRGGAHFVFRQNGERWRNSSGKVAEGVDVRADGGYIVAAPSHVDEYTPKGEHVCGGYQWVDGYELAVPDQLPELPSELSKLLHIAKKRNTPVPNSNQKIGRSGRHDYIRDRVYEARQALMPREAAKEIALLANKTMCDPPIDLDRNFTAELDRMLDWVYKQPVDGLPMGADADADRVVEAMALRQIRHSTMRQADGLLSAIERSTRAVDTPQMPAEIMEQLPEVAKAAFEFYRDGFAYRVQPELWLGSFIALTSTMIAHRVYLPDRTRPNIYCIGVAGTGRGKDATRQWAKHLVSQFGMAGMVDSGRITSMSGIFTSLSGQNPLCLCPDEFGMVISQAVDPGKDSRHAETIVQALLELYSSSSNPHYQLTAYADVKKRQSPIPYPCMSVWAVTTPKTLWQKLSSGAIEAGLIPRFLFFNQAGESETWTPSAEIEPAECLVEWVRGWQQVDQNLMGQTFAPGKPATLTGDAARLLREFRKHCELIVNDENPETLCWSRAPQNAAKLALIASTWQTADSSSELYIDEQAAKWAVSVVEYSVGLVLRQIAEHMVDHAADRICNRFVELVRLGADSEGWCKRRDIQRRMGVSTFSQAARMLAAAGVIESQHISDGRRGGLCYRVVDE